jgi:hypothetical protein
MSRPRAAVANVDRAEFEEAQRGTVPCPGGESRKHMLGAVVVNKMCGGADVIRTRPCGERCESRPRFSLRRQLCRRRESFPRESASGPYSHAVSCSRLGAGLQPVREFLENTRPIASDGKSFNSFLAVAAKVTRYSVTPVCRALAIPLQPRPA